MSPPVEADEVGRVLRADGSTLAILRDDRTWDCPDVDGLADLLSARFADAYRGPQDGPYGVRILRDLAATVGGRSALTTAPDPPPDVLY